MKLCKIDEQGYFVEDVIVEEYPMITVDGEQVKNPLYKSETPKGFYKPRDVNGEWVEGLSQAEIDAIVNQPKPETLEERLAKLDQDIQTNYEMNLENMGVW